MANIKITDLTAYTDPVNTDVLPIVDVTADVTKKVSISNLMKNASAGTAAAPGIAFDGDPNTGIYSPGADQVSITTGGIDRLYIDATGQIEAGSRGTAAAPVFSFTADPNTGVYSPGADQVAISTNGTGRLFVDSTGRVGVNTSTFADARDSLIVSPAASQTSTFFTVKAGSTSGNGWLFFGDTDSNSVGGIAYEHANDAMAFRTNGSERLRIDSSGRLGLGTSSPAYTLDVNGRGFFENGLRLGNGYSAIDVESSAGGLYLSGSQGALNHVFINSSGRLGIGTDAPAQTLEIQNDSNYHLRLGKSSTSPAFTYDIGRNVANGLFYFYGNQTGYNGYVFGGVDGERARIDSSGRLLVGTSTARSNFYNSATAVGRLQIEGTSYTDSGASFICTQNGTQEPVLLLAKARGGSIGSNTIVNSNDFLGTVTFQGSDGAEFVEAARISAFVDGTPGANDMPGRLVFSTTADGASSPTERLRIASDGSISLDGAIQSSSVGSASGLGIYGSTRNVYLASTLASVFSRRLTDGALFIFRRDTADVGSIGVSTTATSYNTSSDYRLKENVTPLTGAIDRLNNLQVHRFNFIADPDKTVDGFIAHEAQAIVPECVTGEKDAVDDEGKPVYQGIDQSKLVPLLTAALQEAIGRIETLEAEVAALKAQ
jgi:hypothetical protein